MLAAAGLHSLQARNQFSTWQQNHVYVRADASGRTAAVSMPKRRPSDAVQGGCFPRRRCELDDSRQTGTDAFNLAPNTGVSRAADVGSRGEEYCESWSCRKHTPYPIPKRSLKASIACPGGHPLEKVPALQRLQLSCSLIKERLCVLGGPHPEAAGWSKTSHTQPWLAARQLGAGHCCRGVGAGHIWPEEEGCRWDAKQEVEPKRLHDVKGCSWTGAIPFKRQRAMMQKQPSLTQSTSLGMAAT